MLLSIFAKWSGANREPQPQARGRVRQDLFGCFMASNMSIALSKYLKKKER